MYHTLYVLLNLVGGVCFTALPANAYPDGPWWVHIGFLALAVGCFYVAIREIR